jgi:hypothetical protein
MKKNLPVNSIAIVFQFYHVRCLLATALFSIFFNATIAQKTWVGQGVGAGTGTDFNTAANWSPSGVPTSTDDVIIAFDNFGTITLSADASIRNLTVTIVGDNNSGIINVLTNTLIVNGTTSVDILSGNLNTQLVIGVNDAVSAGTIDFVGNAIFGLTNDGNAVFIKGNTNSKLIFRADFTQGTNTAITPGTEPGTLLFDGTGVQNFTSDDNQFLCNYGNVIIGSTNNPTVNLVVGLDPFNDDFLGNLSINGSAILNVGLSQWNRKTVGGVFSLSNTAKIILSNNTGGITGSNFPSNFTTYMLDSTSSVDFNGTVAQTIPGITQLVTGYGNLSLSGNTKNLGSNIAIYRNLTVGAATTMALGNFDATLKSNSQTTAYISAVPTTAAFTYSTGMVEIERYLPAYKAWRFLATPIEMASSPTISAAWREGNSPLISTGYGTQITGPAGPVTPLNTAVLDVYSQRGSVKSYVASTNKYVEVTNANTTTLANKEGYFVFVRGDRGVAIGGTTMATNLRMKGKILIGDQVFNVPNIAGGAFQSFGNPYASRIDFRTVTKSTVGESFYVWNPNPAGTFYNAGKYEVYVKDIADGNYKLNAVGATRNYIESGQAVFIQAIAGGSITVKESDKYEGSNVVSRMGTSERIGAASIPTLEINMHTTDVNGSSILADAAVVNFDNGYSNAIDNMDVKKISNTNDNLAISKDLQNIVVERRASISANDSISLNLSGMRIASYRFEIAPSLLLNNTMEAFLKDKFLQIETPISLSDVTNINFSVTTNAGSYAADRFMIVFKPAPIFSSTINKITAKRIINKAVLINWDVELESNVANQQIENSADGANFMAIGNKPAENNTVLSSYSFVDENAASAVQYYRIKSMRTNGSFVYSEIAKVNAIENTHAIIVSPNPVEDKTIHFTLNNLPFGNYDVQIINEAGAKVINTSLTHITERKIYSIDVKKIAATGNYHLLITNGEIKQVELIFIQ